MLITAKHHKVPNKKKKKKKLNTYMNPIATHCLFMMIFCNLFTKKEISSSVFIKEQMTTKTI